MKRILFYPLYSGELGWELMVWQGFIRKAAEEFDEVHGVCFEPFKHLYEDFTDKLYFATPEPKTGSIISVDNFLDKNFLNHRVHYEHGILRQESAELLRSFFASKRN